jgi:decaprenylphospho-beta-D-ribofuranose 2-oxidase
MPESDAVQQPEGSTATGIEFTEEKVGCYTGLFEARASVAKPGSIDELREVFRVARETRRQVTIRGGGHSFDAQPIGNDIVVSTEHLNSIELLDDDRVRVGPGATWGEIFAATQPHGLVPAVTVTTEHATPGGTLSGDCLSRFSMAYGKEGRRVESFELLTTEGDLLQCSEPPAGADWEDLTREQRAFRGAIGGFGYLGAVVSITYKLLRVEGAREGGKIGVRSFAREYETFDRLARDLVPATEQAYSEESDPNDPEKLDAIWSAIIPGRSGSKRFLFFTSAFTPKSERRRLIQHRPKLLVRIPFEWLMRAGWTSHLLWSLIFRLGFRRDEYIDDLEGFTFFMDGNARAKRAGKAFGFSMRNIQQTFVVPFDPKGAGWQSGHDSLVEWLDTAQRLLEERGLTPTLYDVLFLPGDEPFLMSSTAAGAGFAVSYAFETSRESTLRGAQEAFSDLSEILWEKFGGRVHLVKNVFASKQTLAEMYGDSAKRFFALKDELDPAGILRNDFLDRTFGELPSADAAKPA